MDWWDLARDVGRAFMALVCVTLAVFSFLLAGGWWSERLEGRGSWWTVVLLGVGAGLLLVGALAVASADRA